MANDSKQALKTLARKILDQGYLMSLATVDVNGPWVSDVIYVVDDNFNIYWLSNINARHSKALVTNSKVAASITISNNKGEDDIGLQLEGLAIKLKGDDLVMASQYRIKKDKLTTRLEKETLYADQSWYYLKPSKIEIIHKPYWGFTKKVLIIE